MVKPQTVDQLVLEFLIMSLDDMVFGQMADPVSEMIVKGWIFLF